MKNKIDEIFEKKVRLSKGHIGIINPSKGILELAEEWRLICPNCIRSMPNLKFRKGRGCKWCEK